MTSDFSRVWELPLERILREVNITELNIIAYFKAIENRFKDISEDFRKTGIPSDENEVYKIANLWILIFDFVHREDAGARFIYEANFILMAPLGDMAIKEYDNMMDEYIYCWRCLHSGDISLYPQDYCKKRADNYYHAINDHAEKVIKSLQYQREQLETRFVN